jgi:hypothetical protein
MQKLKRGGAWKRLERRRRGKMRGTRGGRGLLTVGMAATPDELSDSEGQRERDSNGKAKTKRKVSKK